MFLVDAGLGTPKICMQDELTGLPIKRATRFENKVGSKNVVAGESLIKKRIEAEPAHLSEYHYLGQARRGRALSFGLESA